MSLLKSFNLKSSSDTELKNYLRNIFGFSPKNVSIYKLAFLHKSASHEVIKGHKISNERLEYLGDAILSAIIADYLYKKFPFKDEGFLTEMRSKLVSRNRLNKLSEKIGFEKFINTDNKLEHFSKTVYGDAFEAFVGALYIDKGYDFAKKIIIENIFNIHLDIDEIENEELNFKSRLFEWAQASKHTIEYKVFKESQTQSHKLYTVQLFVDGKLSATGDDYNIKKAEQNAAEIFLKDNNINPNGNIK